MVYENNKAFLSINESLYSIDDLDTVHDSAYLEAYKMATDLVERINRLPSINVIGLSDASEVDALNKIYNDMSDYQKSFVAQEKVEALKTYTDKIATLKNEAEKEQ